ncbi:MFS transporter [Desulfosarcina ovata]|uniref:MFS transporter n=1 Tax=Desulfosarcina ovata subsp. ovata TaxID=2752305 RepID=A0A5K8ACF8_9BACT|nr:MFS transporter [Desulfosarcina ovata]BBO90305.1 MFS transporter [Desulfosarcina ovata subsp. ovata]
MPKDPIPAKRHSFTALLTLCCLITFGCYFAVSMRLPVVPLYARGFGVSTSQIGMINAAFFLMAGLLSLPSGILSDRLGRKRMAVCGTVVLFIGMLLLCFSRSFFSLAGIYLLLGVGMAAFSPTMMSWVSKISPLTHIGRAYGWYTTALFCGMGMGPAVGGALGEWLGFKPVFLIAATFVAVTIWAVLWFLPARKTVSDHTIGNPRQPLNWRPILTNRRLIGCWLAAFGANIIAGSFFSFLPLLAHDRGLDVGQIGIVYLVQSLTNALSRIPFGTISDRIGRRNYQALAGVVLASLSIAIFAPAVTFVHFLLAASSLGVSLAIAFTSLGALIAETTESRLLGLAMGGYNSFIYFGQMAGSIGLGPLIEAMGFGAGFLLAGAFNLFLVCFFAWSMLERSRDNQKISP